MNIKIEPNDDYLSANTSEKAYCSNLHKNNVNDIKKEDHFVEIKCESLQQPEANVESPATNSSFIDLPELPSTTLSHNYLYSTPIINERTIKTEILEHKKVAALVLKKSVFYERNFVCSVCFDVLPSSDLLQKHKTDHKLKYNTNKSVETFFTNSSKTDELSEQLIKCDECEFKAEHLSQIKTHKITHIKAQFYKCDQCSYKSVHSFNIKTHKRSHTGEKPFKCDICDYKTAYVSHLKNHTKSHTGEKPFKCDKCDYKSVHSYNLKTHKRSHTGEKPFKCNICDYKSAYFAHLKLHKMSHTGEKPFKCDKCAYESVNSWNLKTHKKSHEPKKNTKTEIM